MAAAANASGGGAAVTSVGNSALLNRANSQYLSLSPASDGNLRTFTFSQWQYFGTEITGSDGFSGRLLCAGTGSGNGGRMEINYSDKRLIIFDNEGQSGGIRLKLDPLFHSDGSWHHFVIVIDTTNAVTTERVRAYHNGKRLPVDVSYANYYPALNYQCVNFNNATDTNELGRDARGLSRYSDGYIAETIFIDGQALGPESFGQYDSTGLYWTPLTGNTIKALTFGDNGYYLDNTTNAQTDASGEGNNFTNNNTVTTVDTCTPTKIPNLWNPLAYTTALAGATLSNGNRTAVTGSSQYSPVQATLGMISGKWYCEVRADATSAYMSHQIGITKGATTASSQYLGSKSTDYGYTYNGQLYNNGSAASYGAAYENGDVIGMAIDLDSSTKTLIYYKNGTAQPTIDISSHVNDQPYFFAMNHYNNGSTSTMTLRSAESDWSGTAPTGYSALTTDGMASATSETRTASDTNKYFQTTIYEGNGAGQRVGAFQPFDNTFTVAKSALLGATGYLNRTFNEAGDRQKFTLSTWFKVSDVAGNRTFFASGNTGNESGWFKVRLNDGDQLIMSLWNDLITTRVFKDASQWYHLVLAFDTTQGTAANRIKIYINGVQETVFSTTTYPSLNNEMAWGINSVNHAIGQYDSSANNYWHGYLA